MLLLYKINENLLQAYNSMQHSPPEKLTVPYLLKKFPSFLEPEFITAFTSARHLSLSRVRSTRLMPTHPTSWRFILIFSPHLHLGLPNNLFPSGLPTKALYAPFKSPIRTTCPSQLILLDLIIQITSVRSTDHKSSTWPRFRNGFSTYHYM